MDDSHEAVVSQVQAPGEVFATEVTARSPAVHTTTDASVMS